LSVASLIAMPIAASALVALRTWPTRGGAMGSRTRT
jgi:hypothetical protein